MGYVIRSSKKASWQSDRVTYRSGFIYCVTGHRCAEARDVDDRELFDKTGGSVEFLCYVIVAFVLGIVTTAPAVMTIPSIALLLSLLLVWGSKEM
jgi:hypothetical protein